MAQRADVLNIRVSVDNKEAIRELEKLGVKVEQTGKKAERATDKSVDGFDRMRKSMVRVAAAAAAIGAAVVALDKLAAQVEKVTGLSRGFDTLTKRIGESGDVILQKLRPATRGAVDDLELMRLTNQAIILGLPVTADSMADLAANAVKLGRAMGVDAARSIESVTVGIGRQSKLWLDNIGIVIDAEKAYSDYAESIGKVTKDLTEAERKLAFYNATVAAAETAAEGLNDDLITFADRWNTIKVNITNATTALTRFFASAGERRRQDITQLSSEELFAQLSPGAAAAELRRREREAAAGARVGSGGGLGLQFVGVGDITQAAREADLAERVAVARERVLAASDKLFRLQSQFSGTLDPVRGPDGLGLDIDAASIDAFLGDREAFFEANREQSERAEEALTALHESERQRQLEIDQAYYDAQQRMARAAAAEEAAIQRELFETGKSLVLGLFGSNKAVAIAQALVDTYAAANKVFSQTGSFVLAAAAVAAGLANVQNIRKTNIEGFQSGGFVPGPDQGRDSQVILARPSELVLSKGISDMLVEAFRGGGSGGASGGAPIVINAAALDRGWWEQQGENVVAAIRRASALGVT